MTPEEQAYSDLAATGQTKPPFRPSVILRQLYGVSTTIKDVRHGARQAALLPGPEPRCIVSPLVGTAQARKLVGHEAGHAAMGHIMPLTLGLPNPVFSAGLTLPKAKEAEADRYGFAVDLPEFALVKSLANGPRSLASLELEYDMPETDVRHVLQKLGLWPQVYDNRNRTAYTRSGWWKETRRPAFLADLAHRQGYVAAMCERSNCHRNATVVNHLNYDHDGCERDEDLEGLCAQCHFENHVSNGRIR